MGWLWKLLGYWEVSVDGHWMIPLERVADCRVGLILKGQASWILNGIEYPVEAGDVVIVLPGTERAAWCGAEGFTHAAARFAPRYPEPSSAGPSCEGWAVHAWPLWLALPAKLTVGTAEVEALTAILRQAQAEQELGLPCHEELVDTLVRQFFIRLYRLAHWLAPGQDTPRDVQDLRAPFPAGPHGLALSKAMEFIYRHLAENFSLAEVAATCGYSEAHLRRIFHHYLGLSPSRYILYARMRRAADLLRTGLFSVSETARAVGFDDPFHFSRRFKEIYGVAPSAWRGGMRRTGRPRQPTGPALPQDGSHRVTAQYRAELIESPIDGAL